VQVTEAVREWDYGDYEGLTSKQIKEDREKKGLPPWNIWTDGCPGGEYVVMNCSIVQLLTSNRSPDDIVHRLDAVIADIREKYHRRCFESPGDSGDVLIVAHGHILRAFAMRWTGKPLTETSLILEAGGVGTLR
jgi:probable phosphoglycerate mutase